MDTFENGVLQDPLLPVGTCAYEEYISEAQMCNGVPVSNAGAANPGATPPAQIPAAPVQIPAVPAGLNYGSGPAQIPDGDAPGVFGGASGTVPEAPPAPPPVGYRWVPTADSAGVDCPATAGGSPTVAVQGCNNWTLTPTGATSDNKVTPASAPGDLPAYGAPGSPLQPIPNAEIPANPSGDAYAPNMPKYGPVYKPNGQSGNGPCGGPLAAPCDNTPVPAGQEMSTAMAKCVSEGMIPASCSNLAVPPEYAASHNFFNGALADGTCGYLFPMGNGGIANPLCTPPCKMVVGNSGPDTMLVDNPKLYRGQVCDSTGAFTLPGQPSAAP